MPVVSVTLVAFALSPAVRLANLRPGQVVLFLLIVLNVLGTQDSMVQCEAALELARRLEADSTPPRDIWIGHQYFASEAYGPAIRAYLTENGQKLRNLDVQRRRDLVSWPNLNAKYRVEALPADQDFTPGWPSIIASSWIRTYRFQAYPTGKTSSP